MIKEILKLISDKKLTLNDMAQTLDLSKKDLLGRLALMVQMGYITTSCTPSDQAAAACSRCLSNNNCPDADMKQRFGVVYYLTAKGKKVSGKLK